MYGFYRDDIPLCPATISSKISAGATSDRGYMAVCKNGLPTVVDIS